MLRFVQSVMLRYENDSIIYRCHHVFLNFHVVNYILKRSENKHKPQSKRENRLDFNYIIFVSFLSNTSKDYFC